MGDLVPIRPPAKPGQRQAVGVVLNPVGERVGLVVPDESGGYGCYLRIGSAMDTGEGVARVREAWSDGQRQGVVNGG